MNTIEDFVKSIKETHSPASIFGFGAMSDFYRQMEARNEMISLHNNLSGLHKLTNTIANSLKGASAITSSPAYMNGSTLLGATASMQDYTKNIAMFANASSLMNIAKVNPMLSSMISDLAISRAALSNSLTDFATKIDSPYLSKFNALNIAIQNANKDYFGSIVKEGSWDEIEVAEETNNIIAGIAESVTLLPDTEDKFMYFVSSLIDKLKEIKVRFPSDRAIAYISLIITTISAIFAVYAYCHPRTDDTANTVESRVAISNALLLSKASRNYKVLDTVRTEQEVSIVGVRHKYLFVAYTDMVTGEPKSGYVLKKYFEKTK